MYKDFVEKVCSTRGCDNPGTHDIVCGGCKGFFGNLCDDCADELERTMTAGTAYNERRQQPRDDVRDEAEHVLDHLEHMKEGHQ